MSDLAPNELSEIIARRVSDRDGFIRADVTESEWNALGLACAEGQYDFSALWIDAGRVRMGLMSRDGAVRIIASLALADNSYPSIGRVHAPAIRLERAMRDLYGSVAVGLPDDRPWLDHGVWPAPAGSEPAAERQEARKYRFLPVEGEGLHQIPVGPVHAGIIEPGHFRFTANGETVVRLEERLGYVHKGIESLCTGRGITEAARIVGRVSGDSTVAYAFAFSRAVEAACGAECPVRAQRLRGIMAELERISHHINDFGAICNDVSAVAIHAQCTLLRERILQAAQDCFGHRMMMDAIKPGGVAADLSDDGAGVLRTLLADCEQEFRTIVRVYDESPSIQDRTVTTGIVRAELARQFAAGGYVGRASGRNFDARRDIAYPPYDLLAFEVPVRLQGDVDARAWIRADEVVQSIAMIRRLLDRLEPGPVFLELPAAAASEGAAFVEAFRGDVFLTVRLDEQGKIAHCHARDASWFQWPLLEAAIEGNIVADFPVCNKSFNCSYSGHDI
jgi:Ni,Fe-hydrogenase III large subunit